MSPWCDRASGPRVSVGSEARLGQVAWEILTISAETKVLDFCCSSRQTTQFLVQYSQDVTGLDASPLLLQRARKNVLSANYVEAFAESMPFPDCQFDSSTQQRCDALHAIGAIATNLSGGIPRDRARWSIHFGRLSSTHKSGFFGSVGCIFVVVWDWNCLAVERNWLGEFVGRSGMAIGQFRRRSATKTLYWRPHSTNPSSKVISNPVTSSGVKSSQPSPITEGATGIALIYLR